MKKIKGTREFLPEDKIKQNKIFDIMSEVLNSYGYLEYETPIVEPIELYSKKTSLEIINKQSFKIEGKDYILRPEITPALARMVGNNYDKFRTPSRLYSIGRMFRNENSQKGRLREFWQINCDFFFNNLEIALYEQVNIINDIFKKLNYEKYSIYFNNREWIDEIFELKKWDKNLINVLDNFPKLKDDEKEKYFVNEDFKSFLLVNDFKDFKEWLSINNLNDLLFKVRKFDNLFEMNNVDFKPWIIRGLDYYKGFVFEVFDLSGSLNRALGGGGEYELLSSYSKNSAKTIGFALGEVPILEVIKELPEKNKYDILISFQDEEGISLALKAQKYYIEKGFTTFLIDKKTNIKKVFNWESKCNIGKFVFIGKNEIENSFITEKDNKTRKFKEIKI